MAKPMPGLIQPSNPAPNGLFTPTVRIIGYIGHAVASRQPRYFFPTHLSFFSLFTSMANIFAKKPLALLLGEANSTGHGTLKRTLGAANLVALGVGAIIGAGLFVRTAAAAAQASGPGVTLAFIVAAIGCVFAGLCYAEF